MAITSQQELKELANEQVELARASYDNQLNARQDAFNELIANAYIELNISGDDAGKLVNATCRAVPEQDEWFVTTPAKGKPAQANPPQLDVLNDLLCQAQREGELETIEALESVIESVNLREALWVPQLQRQLELAGMFDLLKSTFEADEVTDLDEVLAPILVDEMIAIACPHHYEHEGADWVDAKPVGYATELQESWINDQELAFERLGIDVGEFWYLTEFIETAGTAEIALKAKYPWDVGLSYEELLALDGDDS